MIITMPNYIMKADIVDAPISHEWEEPWPSRLSFVDARLKNKINELTSRGILSIAIGSAEWIAWRFHRLTQDPIFFKFIEAAWAAIIDRRYLNHLSRKNGVQTLIYYQFDESLFRIHEKFLNIHKITDSPDGDLCKPVRGPLLKAINKLGEVIDRTLPNNHGSYESVLLSNIAMEVVPNKEALKNWRRFVIRRLAALRKKEPRNKTKRLGLPVPREVLDPNFDYQPAMAPELISSFLQKLDYASNPFLFSPEEMVKLGFEGTPYTYDG